MTETPARAETGEPTPWDWLYDLTGIGMWAFVRTRFRVELAGAPLPRVEHGQLWVATHRAETDVPLLAGTLWMHAGMWSRRRERLHFAARDDLFEPGVVTAGLPLPDPLARAVWPVTPGRWMPRVRAQPVRRPTGPKLVQVLRDAPPDTPLESVAGPHLRSELAAAAREHGRPQPRTVADALRPHLARVLWRDVEREELAGPMREELWRRHALRAAGDLRRLVATVSAGRPLLLFPEGHVSVDGAIGDPGGLVGLLARRARPREIVPVGIAYDPLYGRRPLAAVGIGDAVHPDALGGGDLRALLCRATPVTAGQAVAGLLAGLPSPVPAQRIHDAVTEIAGEAAAAGRPVVAALTDPARRHRAVDRTLSLLEAHGALRRTGDRVALADGSVEHVPLVARLVAEHRSLRT